MNNLEIFTGSLLRTLEILSSTLPVIFTSLLTVDLMIRMGWLDLLFKRINPLIKKTMLPPEVSTSFIAAFGSQLSGAVILERLHRDGRINRNELLLTVQINTLPHYIREIFTYFIPVTIPILGLAPGIIYTCSFIFVGLFKLTVIILAGRIILKQRSKGGDGKTNTELPERKGEKLSLSLLKLSIKSTLKHFIRMAKLLVITTLIVTTAEGYGFFDSLQTVMAPFIKVFHIPDKMLVPALTYLGNSTAANYMVGAMYKGGSVGYEIATATVLTGSIMALPIVFLKHSIARNISIFGTRLGMLNTLITFMIGIVPRVIFLIGFLIIVVL